MTQYWKWFAYKRLLWLRPLRRGPGSLVLQNFFENTKIAQRLAFRDNTAQRRVFEDLWTVCAMWQGAHTAMIREWTDALVLSGYHGPAVQKVWSQVDLNGAVQADIRPIVGKHLHGEEVIYPSINPGPPPSRIRQGISHLQPFLKALRSVGIDVHE